MITKKRSQFVLATIAATLATLLVTFVPAPSSADTFRYGGYMCEPWLYGTTGANAENYTGGWSRWQTSMRWTGSTTTTATLVCPIIRNNSTNTTGMSDLDMVVYDSNASYNISCTGYVIETSGATQTTLDFSTQSSSGSGGRQALNWGTALQTGSATAAYIMTCEAGYNIEIWSYDVAEP